MLRAKARMNWLEHGDRNSKFYHAVIRSRNTTSNVQVKGDDGEFTSDRAVIGAKAVDFFKNLFNGYTPPPAIEEMSIIDRVISPGTNADLCKIPDEAEIWESIRNMNLDSAPGPDGYTGHFYTFGWDFIKGDVVKAVQGFFQGLPIPSIISATHLMLLPKVSSVTDVSQLRPISLCNFNHKIISHILMKRLAPILPDIISEEQAGFVPGRLMHDNIALAHDLVYDLDQNVDGGNIVVKLDMAKAYDRVAWTFLIRILRAMGFSETWCDLIYRNISNCSYSVKWDGDVFGFFKSTRGVRQGDPLSPALFIIAMEWFSKSINAAISAGNIKPYKTVRGALRVSHLLFADDILIFCNGDSRSVDGLMSLLDRFCSLSGEKLNPSKSQILLPSWLSDTDRLAVCTQTGFTDTALPMTYLGAPLYKGRTLIAYFQFLLTRVQKRIHGWAKNLLSMGGRIELVKSVLNAMSIHAMFTLPVPATVIGNLVTLMSAFIWDDGDTKKRHWIGWDRICLPKDQGGLGIRHPMIMMQALHGKRAWDLLTGKSLWARYARSRFRPGAAGSPLWNTLSKLMTKVKEVGSWHIGDGSTSADKICRMYGVSTPRSCQRRSLREIFQTGEMRWYLIGVLPTAERDKFRDIQFSTGPDKFSCKLTADGRFSVKEFSEHLRKRADTQPVIRPWGTCIWRRWIPPKISSFIWKLFHRVVPTDDNIRRISIPITSRCRCCTTPCMESSDHLFFTSEWAITAWDKLAAIFDRPRPRGNGSLYHFWLRGKKQSYIDSLASGLACSLLWELWRARNDVIHKSRFRPIWASCLAWAPRLAGIIKAPFSPTTQSILTIQACRLQPPDDGPQSDEQQRLEAHGIIQDDSAISGPRYQVTTIADV